MSDPIRRFTAYQVKTDTARVKSVLDSLRPDMLARYNAAMALLYDAETKTKQVLDIAGVQTILYVPYLDFSRQLFRLSRQKHISGASFALAAQVLLDKWAARGLDPNVLATIRTQVYDITAPTP